jgi:L-rhamnose-H+ transport protein
VLSACANLGFEFAAPAAQAFGPEVHPVMASVARWLPVYWGGSCMVAAYSIVRISLRREWGLLAAPGAGRDLGWAVAAAVLLPLGQLPYGMGAHLLGPLGTSVGFAVNTGAMLLVANLMGIWLGEWREAPVAARRWLLGGLATLMIAMLVLAARAG